MAVLFGLERPRVLLDVNAIRDFFREDRELTGPELNDLRERVLDLSERGELRVMMTQPLLWELVQIVDDEGRDQYEKTLRFYVAIAHRNFELHEHQRIAEEMRLRRALRDAEVFYEHPEPDSIIAECVSNDWIQSKAKNLGEQSTKERAEEAEKRLRTVAELSKNDAEWKALLDDTFDVARSDAAVSGYVRYEMKLWARNVSEPLKAREFEFRADLG